MASRYQDYRDRQRGGPARKPAKCGTYAAARRHQRNGEPLDKKCADALRVHQRAMYEKRKQS